MEEDEEDEKTRRRRERKSKKRAKEAVEEEEVVVEEEACDDVVEENGHIEESVKSKKKKKKKKDKVRDDEKVDQKHTKMQPDSSKSKNDSGQRTVSLAVPSSILKIAQSPLLRCYLSGQIARAAAIFQIDEIIVFDDSGGYDDMLNEELATVFEYLETPQYLRKLIYPLSREFQHIGVISPLAAPHHLRVNEFLPFREGIVTDKVGQNGGSLVNVGLPRDVEVDKVLLSGLRVTIKFDSHDPESLLHDPKAQLRGVVVPPTLPRKELGIYWGYVVRRAHSLQAVFSECPYSGGYDLRLGTSDKGVPTSSLPPKLSFSHLLITFGGVQGLEFALGNDRDLTEEDPKDLFHYYLNTCPSQGCRTIRTEEAILISLASLSPFISPD